MVHILLASGVAGFLGAPWVGTALTAGSALSHATLYGGLLATFAVSLRPGREALVTSLARRLQAPLPRGVAVYTRRVTQAWSLFFAGQLVTSAALLAFAPRPAWSLFVNVLDLPLVALMFVAEYACRLRLVAREHRVGPLTALRAFGRRGELPVGG